MSTHPNLQWLLTLTSNQQTFWQVYILEVLVNLCLTPTFEVDTLTLHATLTDFGLSQVMSGSTIVGTRTTMAGSPGFQAPEQLHTQSIGPHCDVYAFGCSVVPEANSLARFDTVLDINDCKSAFRWIQLTSCIIHCCTVMNQDCSTLSIVRYLFTPLIASRDNVMIIKTRHLALFVPLYGS